MAYDSISIVRQRFVHSVGSAADGLNFPNGFIPTYVARLVDHFARVYAVARGRGSDEII